MKTKTLRRLVSVLAALVMAVSLLAGCGAKTAEQVQEQEDAQTIQVYLWSTSLYETYAPYVQSQLSDVNIEFIVGNNDLDFYKFLQENGGLPDIITCCRFSLHDAAPLKDSLMNLAMTNEAGAVYNTYLNSFKNEDGSVNWLPVCADAHGFVVNRSLFEQYGIPLPTDYESFAAACQAFEKVGIYNNSRCVRWHWFRFRRTSAHRTSRRTAWWSTDIPRLPCHRQGHACSYPNASAPGQTGLSEQ